MELMTLWLIVRHALAYGGVLSAISCVLLLGILWINPEILLKDYPPDIRGKYGPMSERSKRQRLPVTVFFGAVVLGLVAASFVQVRASSGGHIPFLTAFVHLFVSGCCAVLRVRSSFTVESMHVQLCRPIEND